MDYCPLGGRRRGFLPSSSVSSSITHLGVILCLHLSFLSLYLLIATVFVINYGLECVTNLDIAYISYSTHILFDYKLMLVILYLGV